MLNHARIFELIARAAESRNPLPPGRAAPLHATVASQGVAGLAGIWHGATWRHMSRACMLAGGAVDTGAARPPPPRVMRPRVFCGVGAGVHRSLRAVLSERVRLRFPFSSSCGAPRQGVQLSGARNSRPKSPPALTTVNGKWSNSACTACIRWEEFCENSLHPKLNLSLIHISEPTRPY